MINDCFDAVSRFSEPEFLLNEKICILDLKNPGKDRIMDIQKVMTKKTNIRNFSMKMLENGGILIFFPLKESSTLGSSFHSRVGRR